MLKWAERRWERRRAPVRVEAKASVVVQGRTPEQVWAFVMPAVSALLIAPDTVRAFTVPGTGPGVGEQQCFVTQKDGRPSATFVTVVAFEETSYAETRSDDSPVPSGCRFEVESAEGGARLALFSWCEMPADAAVRTTQEALQVHVDQYVERVKVLLEGSRLADLLPD